MFCKAKRKACEVITCVHFPLPSINWNEMISHGDRWENHCSMPAGWFPCFISHFKTPHLVTELGTRDNIQFHSKSHNTLLFFTLQETPGQCPAAAGDEGLTACGHNAHTWMELQPQLKQRGLLSNLCAFEEKRCRAFCVPSLRFHPSIKKSLLYIIHGTRSPQYESLL